MIVLANLLVFNIENKLSVRENVLGPSKLSWDSTFADALGLWDSVKLKPKFNTV